MLDRKSLILGAAGIIVVIIIAVIAISMRQGRSGGGVGTETSSGGSQSSEAGVLRTREEAPLNVVVPDSHTANAPVNVAIPETTAPSNPTESATFRRFSISVNGGKFIPDTVIVNQWDTIHLTFTAVDKDYDFTQADFGFKLPLPKGVTKDLEFGATGQGNFLFYCVSCGGPEIGPKGHLIVTVPKGT
ncbi:MAG: hypothetical protein NUV53_04365 [Patescibacteria group bacterium]|nr:hypothetical protein [Patescibacteria group bacterium]